MHPQSNNNDMSETTTNNNDDYFCISRPIPDEAVEDAWIPTALYRQAVELYEQQADNNNDDASSFLEPTVCPTNIQKLQPLSTAPTVNWCTDRMMPGVVSSDHDCNVGLYHIGRVQLRLQNDWHNVALVVNSGNADVNTGHWGGAFLVEDGDGAKSTTLTPLVWIRSLHHDGDGVTQVEQDKHIPDHVLASFNNDTPEEIVFDPTALLDTDNSETLEECFPEGLFGIGICPGLCNTLLERLVGAAYAQMMSLGCKSKRRVVIPKVELPGGRTKKRGRVKQVARKLSPEERKAMRARLASSSKRTDE